MRNITKSAEPKSLETHRCTTFSHFNNFTDKQVLRESLVAEQRGLCCYCTSRIAANSDKMKIEHWQCQENYADRQLDYSNLLGGCKGGEGKPLKLQHCDTRKRNLDLSKNPADSSHNVEQHILYDADGTIRSTDSVFDTEINEVLNLNLPVLRNNRKAVLRKFIQAMPKHGDWNNNLLEKKVAQLNENQVLEPYCQVVVYWIGKRLNRTL